MELVAHAHHSQELWGQFVRQTFVLLVKDFSRTELVVVARHTLSLLSMEGLVEL